MSYSRLAYLVAGADMESEARAGPFCLSEQSAAYRCYLLTQLAHVRFG